MILTVALMLGLLVFGSRAFAGEWKFDAMVYKLFEVSGTHCFWIEGKIDEQATKEDLLEIAIESSITAIQIDYMESLGQTWVTIDGSSDCDWEHTDVVIAAIMGANRSVCNPGTQGNQ